MERDAIIGIILLVVAIAALISLTIWATKIINHIDKADHKSAREAIKGMQDGK